jgi:hypothetical protein
MRGLSQRLACGVLLTLMVGIAAIAQTPQPIPFPPTPVPSTGSQPAPAPGVRDQLKADLSALLGDRKDGGVDDGAATDRARLQGQLLELLKRIDSSRTRPSTGSNPPVVPRPIPVAPSPEGKSIDPIREGMNRFRDNDFDIALGIFRMIDLGPLGREDRAFVQYMRACCLRRLNKPNEAAITYREIADAHEDDFITECAIWQLSLIRTSQELEAQLEQLRSRTKSR